jgi:hypothetical protein
MPVVPADEVEDTNGIITDQTLALFDENIKMSMVLRSRIKLLMNEVEKEWQQ